MTTINFKFNLILWSNENNFFVSALNENISLKAVISDGIYLTLLFLK